MEEEGMDPVRVHLLENGSGLSDQLRHVGVESDMEVGREDGNSTLSTGIPESGCSPQPEMVPVFWLSDPISPITDPATIRSDLATYGFLL